MTRVLSVRLLVALFAVAVIHGRSDDAPYTQVARVPSVVDGHGLDAFAFDPVDQRLYAGSRNGVFWVDLRDPEPRLKGPMLEKPIGTIEVAPEAGKLFYTTPDEFGYMNLRTNDPPRTLAGRQWRTARLAYEPTRKEMYIATREHGIIVYATEDGERGPAIELLRAAEIESIVVTDTVLLPPEKRIGKITQLTVAPLLAAAIERIHSGGSVGALFQ